MNLKPNWIIGVAIIAFSPVAFGTIRITEFCSDTGNNEHYEFVEVTNVGPISITMSGWSEDDSSATAGKANHLLTGLGTLAPGQSGIITEATPAAFRSFWGLSSSVPVVGGYTNDNLNTTSDSITIFDANGTLVDRLDYSTTNGGSADMLTRTAPLSALGLNNNSLWVNSRSGDSFGSFRAPGETYYNLYGSPGFYAVPEPASLGLLALSALGILVRRRKA